MPTATTVLPRVIATMKTTFIFATLAVVAWAATVSAQDPATGWMAYARGKVPAGKWGAVQLHPRVR